MTGGKITGMKVILDPEGGICDGVCRAIELAETELAKSDNRIYVLGDIIHNEREVERLHRAGLKTLHNSDLDALGKQETAQEARILIRAHGEPPATFRRLAELGVTVIDGTCPVVTKSQRLAEKYSRAGYQVAIVGKHHHPEMIGIIGHTDHKAVIVQYIEDVKKLKRGVPTLVMAQTTISPDHFHEMSARIRDWVGEVEIRDTICRSVVKRSRNLIDFAGRVDVLLVVGGHKSSNTRMLHDLCLKVNPRSYHVATPEEIDSNWFREARTVGVTGSASTPLWLLQEFVQTLESWAKQDG
jgi:4-hydroxy-3-methylbut-2-enyl diphosphate reductase